MCVCVCVCACVCVDPPALPVDAADQGREYGGHARGVAVRFARHAAAEGGAARQHPQLHLDQPRERRLIHSRSRMAIRSWSHSLARPRERCAGLLASQSTHPAPTTLGSEGDCASQASTWSPAAARSTGAPRERSVLTVT